MTGFRNNGGASRSRTEVHGFAIRCIATLPRRLTYFLFSNERLDGARTVLDGPTLGRSVRRRDIKFTHHDLDGAPGRT